MIKVHNVNPLPSGRKCWSPPPRLRTGRKVSDRRSGPHSSLRRAGDPPGPPASTLTPPFTTNPLPPLLNPTPDAMCHISPPPITKCRTTEYTTASNWHWDVHLVNRNPRAPRSTFILPLLSQQPLILSQPAPLGVVFLSAEFLELICCHIQLLNVNNHSWGPVKIHNTCSHFLERMASKIGKLFTPSLSLTF